MLVFPSCFFSIVAKDVDIETARISGGVSLSGIEDSIATDGGGRWYATADNAALHTREKIMAWRAFKSGTGGGIDPFVFPICDARHQPTRGKTKVPHSDGTSFSDDTLYSQGDCEVYVSADAPLRATQIQFSIASLGRPLIGGERFSIDHPTWRHRCYQIGRIIAQDATSATVQFHPPLREAVATGNAVDFNNPRFVARVDGQMSAPMTNPKFASGSVRFVEDMTGSYA
ncbi:hypothetical protein EDF56_101134 [Novosphingobium sp. PhB165]|uniref:hypothetical protein n=1 Tax=Novosphingobium sp. PhB165 TaxID=2485105 RepID=UPI001045FD30|nr:hypothetical protein [Novosphingobium sp. PhB165]TCM21470.1 hypothetical protein EDF56_101134 [Novosphingobium sp. PhB165]